MTHPAQVPSQLPQSKPIFARFAKAWAALATHGGAVLAKSLPAIALMLPAAGHAADRVFPVACGANVQPVFDRGIEALQAAAAERARAAFEEIARVEPTCAMAFWGLATADMGDLRSAPPALQLARGAAAIAQAKALGGKTERECELIDAVAEFYHRHEERTHDMRLVHYERALSRSRRAHPDDPEIVARHAHASKAAFDRAVERVDAAYARRRP